MKWETPTFVEINMSAEIGGYYDDDGDRNPMPPRSPRPETTPASIAADTAPVRDAR